MLTKTSTHLDIKLYILGEWSLSKRNPITLRRKVQGWSNAKITNVSVNKMQAGCHARKEDFGE